MSFASPRSTKGVTQWTTAQPGYPTRTAVVWLGNEPEFDDVEAKLLETAHTVIPVKSVERLKQVLNSRTVDFILTDQMDALVALKFEQAEETVPIYFLAPTDDEVLLTAYRLGVHMVLPRPFEVRALSIAPTNEA